MLEFKPGQFSAQAVMRTMGESEVLLGDPAQIQAVRVRKHRGITIGRRDRHNDRVTPPDVLPTDFNILQCIANCTAGRAVKAQKLIDSDLRKLRMLTQSVAMVGLRSNDNACYRACSLTFRSRR